MKKCPFCAEEIQDAAIVCKHCGRDLKATTVAPGPAPTPKKTSPAAWGCLTLIVLLGVVMVIGALNAPTPTPSSTQSRSAASSAPATNELALLSATGGHSSDAFMKVEGQVENISSASLKSVAAVVTWYDKSDQFITSDTTLIEYDPLLPGQTSPFSVLTRANPAMQKYSVSFKHLIGGLIATEDRRTK